jgi:hypothetical protein
VRREWNNLNIRMSDVLGNWSQKAADCQLMYALPVPIQKMNGFLRDGVTDSYFLKVSKIKSVP